MDGFARAPTSAAPLASIQPLAWHEVGDRIMPGRAPVRFFDMTLRRVGDTTWPAAGAVPMK